jgi:hypothetical protein
VDWKKATAAPVMTVIISRVATRAKPEAGGRREVEDGPPSLRTSRCSGGATKGSGRRGVKGLRGEGVEEVGR